MTEDRIKALELGQREIFKALKELNGTVHAFVSFQRDIDRHNNDIQTLRDRSHLHGDKLNQVDFLNEKVERLQWRADKAEEKTERTTIGINKRLEGIENALPNLKLASSWVFKGTIALIAFGSIGNLAVTLLKLGG